MIMKISIPKAMELLKRGEVVALPTETVYGLAGRADMHLAIDKIYRAKNRPKDNPLIVHFANIEQILNEVDEVPDYLLKLVDNLSPGPVTYILKLKHNSKLRYVTMGRDSIACRIPDDKIFLGMIKLIGAPLAAPSANTSGRPSPTNVDMIIADLGNKISGVVDGGDSRIGIESTILDCRKQNSINILRSGLIGKNEIKEILPFTRINDSEATSEITPGNRYRHYSPNTPIKSITNLNFVPQKSYIIACSEDIARNNTITSYNWIDLGSQFNSTQLAKNLYSKLYSIDQLEVNHVYWLDFIIMDTSSITKGLTNRINKILEQ
jgi:L-threonylcarbamoyladenylate synthase